MMVWITNIWLSDYFRPFENWTSLLFKPYCIYLLQIHNFKKVINALGIVFNSKLQWSEKAANASSKALKALNAIKLIKRYFTRTELLQLITSNVYPILYYNSEIWHLPSLKNNLKQKLLSVSARAIKISMFYPDPMISFSKIHKMNDRAPPDSILL